MTSRFSHATGKAMVLVMAAACAIAWPPATAGRQALAEPAPPVASAARPASLTAPPAASPARDEPEPHERVRLHENELREKIGGKRPDFGPEDPISRAWQAKKISQREYADLSLKRLARPGDLPKAYQPDGELPSSAGLALGYALSLRQRPAPADDELIKATQITESAAPSSSAAAGPWPECDAGDWNWLFQTFDCKKTLNLSQEINIYYRIDGLKPEDGLPATDSNGNGTPDAIETFSTALATAWTTYESWNYTFPDGELSIFFGIDSNQNPGLTLPFGDRTEGETIIALPSDPGPDRYTYLAYHELFHVAQYEYLPYLNLIVDLPGVNWWMEATAEWATHRMFLLKGATAQGWDVYSNGISEFLSDPENAVNASTWPWEAHKRQYGAMILAQYLTEQTDNDFARKTWDEIVLDSPVSSIQSVLQDYGKNLRDLLAGFAVANYRLATDLPDLANFVGAPVGYKDTDVPGLWRTQLGGFQGRPKRSGQHALVWNGSATGSPGLGPGGTTYVEFTGPSGGQSRLSLEFTEPGVPVTDMTYLLVTWPSTGGSPAVATPSRWALADDTRKVSIAVNPGEVATLIMSRLDVAQSPGTGESSKEEFGWKATMVAETTSAPNSALNAQWSNQASNAKCADWSGGDAVGSTPLPGGRRAWFFSGTFLGDPAKRGPGNETSYLNNSVVVQDGTTLRTMTGGSTCRETDPSTDFWSRYAKTPVGEGAQYWTGDAKLINNEVVKFYYEGIGDEGTKGSYARIPVRDLESGNVLRITPTALDSCAARPPAPIIWGASLIDHDGYTYIYGWEAKGADDEKSLFLARVPNTGSVELLDQKFWTYYGGPASNGAAQWVTSCSTAVPLTPKSEVEFSVAHLNGRFWLVHHTPASQAPGKIVAVPSLTPWGFGTQQIDLYTPPETQTSPQYATVHGARIQPFVLNDPGKISIAYTVGTSAVKASCWTRGYYFPDNQYPRFIDVPVTAFFTPKTP